MNIGTTGIGPVAPAAGTGSGFDEQQRVGTPRPERTGVGPGVAAPLEQAAVRRGEAGRDPRNRAGEGEPFPDPSREAGEDGRRRPTARPVVNLPDIPLRELSFRVSQGDNHVVIQVIDARTKEVVREIPPEDVVRTLEDLGALDPPGLLSDPQRTGPPPPRRAGLVDGEA